MASTSPQEDRNVNHWIKIATGGGQLQVRLSPTVQEPSMHPQETCSTLTPGPSLPDQLKASYAIRKHILYGKGTPVILNIYDCSNSATVATVNEYLKSMGKGGMFHAGIEVHGREYSFGGTRDPHYRGTGIFTCPPKQCTQHHYRESVYLGDCELSRVQVAMVMLKMELDWKARSYNLFRHNCCYFSKALAAELGVGDLPEWVCALSENAEGIEPTLLKLNHYLGGRQAAGNQPGKDPSPAKPEAHEAMLDHAMAARIQRRYRTSVGSTERD